MQPSTLGAIAVILGSLVAAIATVGTAWITQRTLHRRQLVREEMRKRERLYAEFISLCAKLLMDALTHTLESPEPLLPAYALVNRIRLSASAPVLAEAERLLHRISDQFFAQNLSIEQLRQLVASDDADPLKPFAEACRHELRAVHARA